MRIYDPSAYALLYRVYLGPSADVALPEHWKRKGDKVSMTLREYWEDGLQYILYWADVERRILFWPTPDTAKQYTNEQKIKRREARYHYYKAREEGDKVSTAVRKAATAAHCSTRAVRYWVFGRKKALPNTNRKPST